MQIAAIFSDYDGTLCRTASIMEEERNFIPDHLNAVLWKISDRIPICIVSSKDFSFLHSRTKFSSVISCILGIETLIMKRHSLQIGTDQTKLLDSIIPYALDCSDLSCVKGGHIVNSNLLKKNSLIINQLADEVGSKFQEVNIEKKFTVTNKGYLAGITIDWRHMKDWKSFKLDSEPLLNKIIHDKQMMHSKESELYVQTYTTHPFIDVYVIRCNKGIAFDHIVSGIPDMADNLQNIMYLGDSENDNPAFRKAGVSVGIHSDNRLKPQLDCKHHIDFNHLPAFLNSLLDNNLEFSEDYI